MSTFRTNAAASTRQIELADPVIGPRDQIAVLLIVERSEVGSPPLEGVPRRQAAGDTVAGHFDPEGAPLLMRGRAA